MSTRRELLETALSAARRAGTTVFASVTERVERTDPLDAFAAARGARFFWSVPERGLALAAWGERAAIETNGPDRFARAQTAASRLFEQIFENPADGLPAEAGARLVGGFAFDALPAARDEWEGWPALRFALPAHALLRAGDAFFATSNLAVAPNAELESLERTLETSFGAAPVEPVEPTCGDPLGYVALADRAPEAYRRGVERALEAIADGELEKVVLARACMLSRPDGFKPAAALSALRAQHASCFIFGVEHAGACFVGATPERLLRRRGRRLEASALAGSARRGRTPEEDERRARALLESKKEQAEHACVRRAIEVALAPLVESLEFSESPELLRLDSIQHLHTPFSGTLSGNSPSTLLELVARLHPTPAVCGAPRAAAKAFLAAHEALERGWYAGGIGWLAPNGDGELAVALRCALLAGVRATVFAGAGVVEGSDPDAELAETRLKLQSALGALVEL